MDHGRLMIVSLLALLCLTASSVEAASGKRQKRQTKKALAAARKAFVEPKVTYVRMSAKSAKEIVAASDPVTRSGPAKNVVDVAKRFTNYDFDGDGTAEIRSLSLMPFEAEGIPVPTGRRLSLVLVSPNVLEDILSPPQGGPSIGKEQLVERLKRWKADLAAENHLTRFLVADVYGSKVSLDKKHQDGKTLLAMREFLRAVREIYGGCLVGVVLVGPFPEAMLVRRWVWQDHVPGKETVNGVKGLTIGGKFFPKGTRRFRHNAEITAERAEIVLADLRGNWEKLYVQAGKVYGVEGIPDAATDAAGWPKNFGWITCPHHRETTLDAEDFFFIDDGRSRRQEPWFPDRDPLKIQISFDLRHPEICAAELKRPNPVARPDLIVSRINARNVARNPSHAEGKALIDGKGNPVPVNLTGKPNLSSAGFSFFDRTLERRILIDYFDRNHAHRRKLPMGTAYRGAAMTHPESDFTVRGLVPYVEEASASFKGKVLEAPKNPTPVDFVRWLKTPAVLRVIKAHASCDHFGLSDDYRPEELLAETRGRPFRWVAKGRVTENGQVYNCYEPSFEGQGGAVDWALLRTLFESRVLRNCGANFYIHAGCKYNSPVDFKKKPFSYKYYAPFQGAESLLFFANGLALVARSKTFYDLPRWFTKELGFNKGDRAFGAAWTAYFAKVSLEKETVENFGSHKKAYNWSVLGDWTLKMKY